jgi:hypothetical protein
MAASSRRSFLTIAGAGAAGVGLSTALGGLTRTAAGAPSPADVPPAVPADLDGALVAYIENVQGDSVSLMLGAQEVVVSDPALVARLVDAASTLHSSV